MLQRVSRRKFLATSVAGGIAAAGLPAGAVTATADSTTDSSATTGLITVGPTSPQYADLTQGFNIRWVGNPDTVMVAHTRDQVVQVVQQAVKAGKRLTVRSGGHCFRDFVFSTDVNVVLDISQMKRIAFDPGVRAFSVEPGATLGEVYQAVYRQWGVTIPGGSCPTVGIGGHIAGGGYGPLCRLFGLSVDHLCAVEVVVVDKLGNVKVVIATSNPADPNRDLWWAHTGGGGGSFGVVTKYFFRSPGTTGTDPTQLLPRPPAQVLISTVQWPWAQMTSAGFAALVRNYGNWFTNNSAPGSPLVSLFSHLVLTHQSNGLIEMNVQLDASLPNVQQQLSAFIFGAVNAGVGFAPTTTERRVRPWLHATEWSGFIPGQPNGRSELKSAYLKTGLTDAQIAAVYASLTRTDYANPLAQLNMIAFGGNVNSVASDATAFAHRDSVILLQYLAGWGLPADDATHVGWVRKLYGDTFADTGGVPVPNAASDGAFINYADSDLSDTTINTSGVSWQTLYWKSNYARLQQVKAKYDPTNFFRHAQSIRLPGS
jgi:hypothetical protein